MQQVDTYISVTEAKSRLLELVRQMARKDEVVAITRDGTPAAVLLSATRFRELMETLEILSDSRTMTSLRRSLGQAAKGKWVAPESALGAEEH
jgi:prevent-host-death family protein